MARRHQDWNVGLAQDLPDAGHGGRDLAVADIKKIVVRFLTTLL
jgi:hypothetical protein